MNLKKQNEKRALTLSEAAEYACVSQGTILNWISQRILPFEKLPSRGRGSKRFILIRLEDLKAFLDSHYYEPQNQVKTKNNKELILLPHDNKI